MGAFPVNLELGSRTQNEKELEIKTVFKKRHFKTRKGLLRKAFPLYLQHFYAPAVFYTGMNVICTQICIEGKWQFKYHCIEEQRQETKTLKFSKARYHVAFQKW